jgi:hypothetical protein
MNNIEIVSYNEYPLDAYTKAICTLLIEGKYLVAYGQKMMKDGGVFWTPATFSVQESETGKKFIDGFSVDSKSLNNKLLDYVRQQAKVSAYMQSVSALVPLAPLPPGEQKIVALGEKNDNLPF